jgi:hypothetical protein
MHNSIPLGRDGGQVSGLFWLCARKVSSISMDFQRSDSCLVSSEPERFPKYRVTYAMWIMKKMV